MAARLAALLVLTARGVTAGDDGIQTTPAMGAPLALTPPPH